jgi:hypothetical protein
LALIYEEYNTVTGLQHHDEEKAGREFAHFYLEAIKKQVVAELSRHGEEQIISASINTLT